MFEINVDGSLYKVEILETRHIGYTSTTGFDDVSRLPKYEVVARVNGGPSFTQEVTFSGHHIIEQSRAAQGSMPDFLTAIDFKANSFAQNGVPLPNFATASSPPQVKALAAYFGAFHTGRHPRDVGNAISLMADEYARLLNTPNMGDAANRYASSAKVTVNGTVARVGADLLAQEMGRPWFRRIPILAQNTLEPRTVMELARHALMKTCLSTST